MPASWISISAPTVPSRFASTTVPLPAWKNLTWPSWVKPAVPTKLQGLVAREAPDRVDVDEVDPVETPLEVGDAIAVGEARAAVEEGSEVEAVGISAVGHRVEA
jgi:hypothetical protein